jgi:hypothetical protein
MHDRSDAESQSVSCGFALPVKDNPQFWRAGEGVETMKSDIASDSDEITKLRAEFRAEFEQLRAEMEGRLRERSRASRTKSTALCEADDPCALEPDGDGNRHAELTDRRGMLKKVAGLAVGVAAAGLLRPSSSAAARGEPDNPEATDGNMIIGRRNFPTNVADATRLVNPDPNAFLPYLWATENYGLTDFSVPANSFITSVAYTNNANSQTTFGTFIWALRAIANAFRRQCHCCLRHRRSHWRARSRRHCIRVSG